ncbi:MAG: GntR family transcriptional regulator [Mycobacterium sp.]|nr:GntR family transcriptional regulator [Mycobacterium sp.]
MALGWPVGQVLGSESELLERYGVSRAVLREAVRLVERQQVARTRRGPGGGLIITDPTVDAVIDAVVLYLYRVEARLDEVFEARVVLEQIATEMAADRLDEHDFVELRRFVDNPVDAHGVDPRALHTLVASATHNPALELLVEVLNRVAMLYSSDWRSYGGAIGGETVHAHARIAEAIMAGDPGLARHRMGKHLEAEAKYLRRRRSTRQLLPTQLVLGENGNGKLAEAVARNITQQVIDTDLQPGQLVGTEPELIEEQGVSRAVFREAVRLLEHHELARMRRGPGGGLFVVAPSASAVTDIAAIYLARRGMRLAQLAELRTSVEVVLVQMAADRIDAAGIELLNETLEREASSSDEEQAETVHSLHASVAAVAGNRVLELVALVLIRLSRLHQIEKLAPNARKQIRDEVHRTHEGIAAAVESGDRELARHRMQRHLEALGAVMKAPRAQGRSVSR